MTITSKSDVLTRTLENPQFRACMVWSTIRISFLLVAHCSHFLYRDEMSNSRSIVRRGILPEYDCCLTSSVRYLNSSILLVLSRRNSDQGPGIRTFGFTFRRTPWPRSSHVCPLIDIVHPMCVSFPFDSSVQVENVYICFHEMVSSASEGVYNVSDTEWKGLMLLALDMTAYQSRVCYPCSSSSYVLTRMC